MKLDSSFTVPEAAPRTFELFLDAPTMQTCIPGCEELVRVDENHFRGRLVNEIAHVRFNATFSAEIVEIDPPNELHAVLQGEDRRLASSLKLNATLRVRPENESSIVSYTMEMAMWGKLGRMGESIFRRRTEEVERQFVEAFTAACQGTKTTTEPPVVPAGVAPASDTPASDTPAAGTSSAPARLSWWRRLLAFLRPSSGRGR